MSALRAAFERVKGRPPRVAFIGQGDGLIESAAAQLQAAGLGEAIFVGPGGASLPAISGSAKSPRCRSVARAVRDGIHALDCTNLLFAAGLTASGASTSASRHRGPMD
jgi:hypothetical protein